MTPVGSQSSARDGQLARLRPAAEQVQRLRDVAAQEVAVDGLEAGLAGVVDAAIGHVDRLGPPADEVEDGGQVGRDPEQRLRVAEGARAHARRRGAGRWRPPGRCPRPSPRRGSSSRGCPARRATGSHARATRIASLARRWASVNAPSSILSWARPASDRRAFRAGLARHELDGAAGRLHRAVRVAGRPADVGQALVEQAEADAVAAAIQGADGGLEVGHRARRSPDREGRLRGPDLEVRVDRLALRAAASRGRAARPFRDGEGVLEGGQLVGRGVPGRRDRGRLDGRRAGEDRIVGVGPQLRQERPAGRPGPSRGRRGGGSGRSAAGRAPRPARSPRGGRRSGRRAPRRTRARAPRPGRPGRRRPGRHRRDAGRSTERGAGPVRLGLERLRDVGELLCA